MAKIGLDVDGVLADFNAHFIDRLVQESGRDLFPPRPFDIPMWQYPTHYGYTALEESTVWNGITADRSFWQSLPAYEGVDDTLELLSSRQQAGDYIYFITSRPGVQAKEQTQDWLWEHGFSEPTVLICSNKGAAAAALDLDVYIDDRDINARDAANVYVDRQPGIYAFSRHPRRHVYLLDRPWNRWGAEEDDAYGLRRIYSLSEFTSLLP